MDTRVRAAPPSGSPQGRGHSVQQNELYCSPAGKLFLDVFKGTVHTIARGDRWSSLSRADPGASQGTRSLHAARLASSHPPAWTGRLLSEKTPLSPGSLSDLPGVGGRHPRRVLPAHVSTPPGTSDLLCMVIVPLFHFSCRNTSSEGGRGVVISSSCLSSLWRTVNSIDITERGENE